MTIRVVCELIGPPAAGKSRLANQLRSVGFTVIQEQLQLHTFGLGPKPTEPRQWLVRQQKIIDLVIDAIELASAWNPVVDVGIVSALIFAMSQLPREMQNELIDQTIDRAERIGISIGSICFVYASELELRRRAALDSRQRRSLEKNLKITPHVETVINLLHCANPENVLKLSTDDPVDVWAVSEWILSRTHARTDVFESLQQIQTSISDKEDKS